MKINPGTIHICTLKLESLIGFFYGLVAVTKSFDFSGKRNLEIELISAI